MINLYFFGFLPDPATNSQLLIQELNYNSLLVDAVIITLLLWFFYVIVTIGYLSKINIDNVTFWDISEKVFKFGVKNLKLKEDKLLEFAWTLVPGIIILLLVIPSVIATYIAESQEAYLTPMKIIGNQWFWTSEHTIMKENLFSEIKLQHLSKENSIFLLVNDKPIILPIFYKVPFIVTSNDVIHSFSLPECGIKIDGIPGRLNQVFAHFNKIGYYSGMCSELCGVGHAKMPINVSIMSFEGYLVSLENIENKLFSVFEINLNTENNLFSVFKDLFMSSRIRDSEERLLLLSTLLEKNFNLNFLLNDLHELSQAMRIKDNDD